MAEYGVADKIADSIIKNHIDLDRFAVGILEKVVGILEKAQQEIIGKVAEIDPAAPTITKWKQERLEKLNQKISDILDTSYKKIDGTTMSALKDIAGISGDGTAGFLNAAIGANIFDVTLTPELLNSIATKTLIDGHIIGEWWQKQSADTKQRLIGQMNQAMQQIQVGLVEGESIGEMIRRIRGTKLTPGVMSVSKREAAALVRTSVHQVVQEVRKETYRQNEDVLKGYEVVATLDKRTTPLCRALDRKQFDMEFKPIGHLFAYPAGGPPFHWNCRTTLIPITKSYRELMADDSPLSAKKKDLLSTTPIGSRASMGGQVQGRIDYNEWLLAQPEDVQLDVLGPTRLQLWKENKLAMQDMVHQDGRALTIQELKDSIGKGAPQFREKQMLENLKATAGTFETMDAFQMYIDTMPEGKLALRLIGEAGETPVSLFNKVRKEIEKVVEKVVELERYVPITKKTQMASSLQQFGIKKLTAPADSIDLVNAIGETYEKVFERLPKLSKLIKNLPISTFEIQEGKYVLSQGGKKCFGLHSFDKIKISSIGRGKTFGPVRVGKKTWSVDNSVTGTARHEFCHHIHELLNDSDYREWRDIYEHNRLDWWEAKVSGYSLMTVREAFAESLSAFTHPDYIAGMLPKEIETFFVRVFGKLDETKLVSAIRKSEKDLVDYMKLSAEEKIILWREAGGIEAEIIASMGDVSAMSAEDLAAAVTKRATSGGVRAKYWKLRKTLLESDELAKEAMASLEKEGLLPGDYKLQIQAIKGRMAELRLGTVKPIVTEVGEAAIKAPKVIVPEVVIPPKPVIPDILAGSKPITFTKGMALPEGVFRPVSKAALNPIPSEIPSPAITSTLRRTSGTIIVEPDGKVWLMVNKEGEIILPKGAFDDSLTLYHSAEKTVHKLTGIDSDIVGLLGDYERGSTIPRFYVGRRTGGIPASGLSNKVILCPLDELEKMVTDRIDKVVARDFVAAFKRAESLGKGNVYDGFTEMAKEIAHKAKYEELIAMPEVAELGLVVPEGLGYKATAEFIEASAEEAAKTKVLAWSTSTGAERKAFDALEETFSPTDKAIDRYRKVRDKAEDLRSRAKRWIDEMVGRESSIGIESAEARAIRIVDTEGIDDVTIKFDVYKAKAKELMDSAAVEMEGILSKDSETSSLKWAYDLLRKEAAETSNDALKRFDAMDDWTKSIRVKKKLAFEEEKMDTFFAGIKDRWTKETYGDVVKTITKDYPTFLDAPRFKKMELLEKYGARFDELSEKITKILTDEEIRSLYLDSVHPDASLEERYELLKELVAARKSAKPIVPEVLTPTPSAGKGKFMKDYSETDSRTIYGGIKKAAISGKIPSAETKVARLWEDLDPTEKKRIIDLWASKKVEISPAFMEKYYPKTEAAITEKIKPVTIKPVPPIDTNVEKLKISDFVQYAPQQGSNPGGFYALNSNPADRWYFKLSDNIDKLDNELLAIKLYKLAGVEVPDLAIVTDANGVRKGIASRIIDGVEKSQSKLLSGTIQNINDNFMVDAWLSNWDVVGGAFDNLVIKDGARAIRIDVGGALRYRARGELKGSKFGKVVKEIDDLRNPSLNPNTSRVFKDLTRQQMQAGAAKVAAIRDSDIRKLVETFGPQDALERAKLFDTLVARKKYIIDYAEELTAIKPAPPLPEIHEISQKAMDFGASKGKITSKTIDELVADANLRLEKYTDVRFNESDIKVLMKRVENEVRFCTNIPLNTDDDVYNSLLKDCTLKNQFVRGEGGMGYQDPTKGGSRDLWEKRYSNGILQEDPVYQKMKEGDKFISSQEQIEAAYRRPYYGYVHDTKRPSQATQYGRVTVVFKPYVRERATFCMGNSSDSSSTVKGSMGNHQNALPLLKALISNSKTQELRDIISGERTINQIGFGQKYGYIEGQMYGKLRIDRDAQFLVWREDGEIPKKIKDFADRWNVKIYKNEEFMKMAKDALL